MSGLARFKDSNPLKVEVPIFIRQPISLFQLKTLRGVLVAGGADYDEFNQFIRVLEPCLVNSLKDLRSQVVREAAITVA